MNNKKTVFISGSNRGIGRATAELFAKRGWNVIAHARSDSDNFEKFVNELAVENDVKVIPIYFDLQDEEMMKEQIKTVISKPKITIDALVNNAGICEINLFLLTSLKAIQQIFDVNLFSQMRVTQLLLKRMPQGSTIINVASIDGLLPKRGESAYAASKAALIAWTEVLRQELVGRIRVNAVAPCAVNTDLAHNIREQANWNENELIDAADVAKAIYYLSSDDAMGVTGEILKITGKQI